MTTKGTDRGLPDVAKSTRVRRQKEGVVVYSEFSITMRVSDFNEFIKFTIGHERLSPSDTDADLNRTERDAHKWNQAVVDRRTRSLMRMLKQLHAEEGT